MFIRRVLLPLHERLLNRSTFQILRQVEQPTAPAERESACRRLLDHAFAEIPFWQERLPETARDTSVRSVFEALLDVPVLTRKDIVTHRAAMVWQGAKNKVIEHQSSGTTDDNLVFFWDRLRQSWDSAMRMRALSRLGTEPGDRVMHLWPIEPRHSSWYERMKSHLRCWRDWATNDIIVDPRPFEVNDWARVVARCRRYQPKLIVAYPSWLFRLATYVAATKSQPVFRRLECLYVCGEVLFDFQREFLEATFGVPVRQEYGSQDSGPMAHEDREGELRFNSEVMHVEFLRGGRPAAAGELAEVVMTHLYSQTMPFIRYATGDVVRCPVDDSANTPPRIFPRPEGRTSDIFVSEEKGLVPQREIVEELVRQVGHWDFSIYQEEEGCITIYDGAELDAGKRRTASAVIHDQLGEGLQMNWKTGGRFREFRSGKKRFACSLAGLYAISHDQESGVSLARAWPQDLIDARSTGKTGEPRGA